MFILYTKENCSYCNSAKALLKARGLQYEEKVVGKDFNREFLLELVPQAQSFPQIFNGDAYIGGFSQLVEHLNNSDTQILFG